jgi:hypothetical protein
MVNYGGKKFYNIGRLGGIQNVQPGFLELSWALIALIKLTMMFWLVFGLTAMG